MSMYGKYPKIMKDNGKEIEQNGLDGSPKAWPTTDCSKDVRLTSQAAREEVDINKIVKRMEAGQMIDSRIIREGVYEDVSELNDLSSAIIKVQKAWDNFMELPAEVRERFDNNPTKLVEFLEDGKNRDEAVKLGLVKEKPAGSPATIPPESGDLEAPK